MQLSDFDFDLPPEAIARFPAEPRDSARLLVVNRQDSGLYHRRFSDIVDYLQAGDCLVLNNSRVIPARLFGKNKERVFEILLLSPLEEGGWGCLVRPGKKVKSSLRLEFEGNVSGRIERAEEGFRISFSLAEKDFFQWLDEHGEVPLPPYLNRSPTEKDKEDYQTVFARHPGSVAAPTAGLHFTQYDLEQVRNKGVQIAWVTLHIGRGTFQPLKEESFQKPELHAEVFEIPHESVRLLEATRVRGGRILPVGTTSLRVIESFRPSWYRGQTRLFIRPGYQFRWADGLLTNFHLPRSSLFVLVASLLGISETHRAYREAIQSGYRFYSYGDAMLVL